MLNRPIKSVFVVVVVSIAISGCRDDSVSQPSLHEAVKRNDIALVKSLLDSGADVNTKDNKGLSPLRFATSGEVVEILLAQGCPTKKPRRPCHCWTYVNLLHVANCPMQE